MNTLQQYSDDFYAHLAKLFYSIAYIDGEIRPEEEEELYESLRKEWLQKYRGKPQVIEEVLNHFHQLKAQTLDADACFYEFVQYKKENECVFSIPLRNTLWEVSCAIADRVNRKNKSELILLVNLGKQLGIMK